MLYDTVSMAKFYRILGGPPLKPLNTDNLKPVQQYRDLLNEFFKLFAKLNQSVDQLSQESEVFKLRLTVVNLK